MAAVKLEHSNLAQHQASILKNLQTFWKEGQICDLVLKSRNGTEHRAHTAVLCAASVDLKNMLLGPFLEASQVQQGQPVEIAASDAVVLALLEYIYGGQPEVELEDAVELLRLADAFNFQELSAALAVRLGASLDAASVATALKMLPHIQDLHKLKAACEKKIAANFETCIELIEFLELSHGQLGRILRRQDLSVTREEVVLKGLLNWFNRSKDRGIFLGLLLQNIDFQSLSSSNLTLCERLSASMGLNGHDVQGEVAEALLAQMQHSAARFPDAFRPRRHCLQHWSPDLGASSQVPQKVLDPAFLMRSHNGAIYYFASSTVFRWKPADNEHQAIAGWSTQVDWVNNFSEKGIVSVCPEGDIFVLDLDSVRLLRIENALASVVLSGHGLNSVFCSPNGVVYVLTQDGEAVEKVVGATLQPLISWEDLPEHLQFRADDLFVTKEEVVYILDSDNGRILRIKPGEVEPAVLGEAPNTETADLQSLFVTEDEKIYVADYGQWKVWAFHPGDAAWTEVVTCPGWLRPCTVVVQGGSLYVSMVENRARVGEDADGIYEYLLLICSLQPFSSFVKI